MGDELKGLIFKLYSVAIIAILVLVILGVIPIIVVLDVGVTDVILADELSRHIFLMLVIAAVSFIYLRFIFIKIKREYRE